LIITPTSAYETVCAKNEKGKKVKRRKNFMKYLFDAKNELSPNLFESKTKIGLLPGCETGGGTTVK
jgi:hypothetical protein